MLQEGRSKINKKSFFPELHDLARHAFHYSEIIDVAENTLSGLIEEQSRWRKEDEAGIREGRSIGYWLDSHQELVLQQKNAYALKAKSKSLNERLLNEINLVSLLLTKLNHVGRFVLTALRDSTLFCRRMARG